MRAMASSNIRPGLLVSQGSGDDLRSPCRGEDWRHGSEVAGRSAFPLHCGRHPARRVHCGRACCQPSAESESESCISQ